jgi:hypothetical protein
MGCANDLPVVASIGADGVVRLVSGTYATDRPLPIVGDMLQTRDGPVRVGGQFMTTNGPVLLPPPTRQSGASYPRDVRYGVVTVTEYDPNGLGPLQGRPGGGWG